jgi:diacylglycerol kinase family enzyme
MSRRRLAALGSLLFAGITVTLAVAGMLRHPVAFGAALIAVVATVEGVILVVTTHGSRKMLGGVLDMAAVIVLVAVLILGDAIGVVLAMIASGLITTILALAALRRHAYGPSAERTPPPRRPFIVMNRRSGGGKVQRFDLDAKARRLGAQVAYLDEGLDVGQTLRQAVRDGADLLGAAGGDGTQAFVAQVAAEHGLPMMCIPAGTRNHFALDLGLDPDDPSLALDALTDDGEEIRIDLGEASGRPFVNNVSLGAYAEMVARPEYRGAKLETAIAVLPEVTEPGARSNLAVESEGQDVIEDPQLVQIANNPYAKADEPPPMGTRSRLDTGVLGVYVVAYKTPAELRELVSAARRSLDRASAYRSWTCTRVRIRSRTGTVRAGVDGEAIDFASPLDITIRPHALRVRVPKDRPGHRVGWPRVDRPLVLMELWAIASGSGDTSAGADL